MMTSSISRRNLLKTGLSLAALTAAGAGFAERAEAIGKDGGGVLNIGVNAEMNYNMLCFSMTGDNNDFVYSWPIYESLFRPSPKGTVEPWLLESSIADPAGLTYTFKVRPGVTFSDGTPLDGAALKWNLDHYMQVGSKRVALLGAIKSTDLIDASTVRVNLSVWSSIIPAALSRECGYMFSPTHFVKYGETYCQQNPVGTGPFTLKSWTRNIGKQFVRNEKYWGGKVKLDGINYTVYNDPLVAQAAMISGEIDAFSGFPLSAIKPMADRGFVIATPPLTDHSSVLVFNSQNATNDDPTGNLLVRKAISHAVDRDALVKAAYRGTAVPQNQFGIGTHFFNKDIVGYNYDLAKAKALMTEAGFPNGFSTSLQAFNTGSNADVLQIIQADLAKIGIKAKIEILSGAAGNQKMTGWGQGLWYHTPSVNVDVAMQMASIWSQGLTGSVLGLATMLHPDDVHAELQKSVSAFTDAESVRAVGAANKLLIDKYAIYMPIAEYAILFVLNKRVKDSGIGASFYTVATLADGYLEK